MKKRENYELLRCDTGVIVVVKVRNIGRIGVVFQNSVRHETGPRIPHYIFYEAREMLKTPNVPCSKCNNCGIRK
jgi:hypothetical protein